MATTGSITNARGRRRVGAAAIVAALLAALLGLSASPSAADHLGGTPSPIRVLPICQTIPEQSGACPEKSDFFTVSASGSLYGSSTVSVTVNPTIPACNTWNIPDDIFSPSPCYSRITIAPSSSGIRCVYLDDSSGELLACPRPYEATSTSWTGSATRSSTWRRPAVFGSGPWATCDVGSDFNTYFYGGPTNLDAALDMRWAWVGPTALDCDLTMEGGTPDNLMGASWAIITARIQVKTSGAGGVVETHTAEVYQNINGTLSDDAPHPTTEDPPDPEDPDPNVPGDPDDGFEPLGPFNDVPGGSYARADIELIYERGITKGTSPSTYGPSEFVTREQMAAFLARLWRDSGAVCPDDPAPFTDTGTSFATDDVVCIFGLGVTKGTSPTTYSPGDRVTREQMAAFLARIWRALGNECPAEPGPVTPFTDVPDTSFAKDDVRCIWRLGITNGTSATTYSPTDYVTREQMAAFLARLIRKNEGLPSPGE